MWKAVPPIKRTSAVVNIVREIKFDEFCCFCKFSLCMKVSVKVKKTEVTLGG